MEINQETILVTGASGTVGSEVIKQIKTKIGIIDSEQ
jgi:FlaA1/EpsC-like NDP-sugar epimerase